MGIFGHCQRWMVGLGLGFGEGVGEGGGAEVLIHASIKIQATLKEVLSVGVGWFGCWSIAKLNRSVGCRSGTICELAGRG